MINWYNHLITSAQILQFAHAGPEAQDSLGGSGLLLSHFASMKESSSHCFYEKKIREIELFYYYYYSFHEYFPEWKFMVFKLTSQPPQYSQFVVTSVGQMAGLRFKIPPWSDPIVLPTIQI